MKIVESNNDNTKVVSLSTHPEAVSQIPIEDVIKAAQEAELRDIVVIGRRKNGPWSAYLACSCETGMVTYMLLQQALFHVEQSLFNPDLGEEE
jgi:hypothetical protein